MPYWVKCYRDKKELRLLSTTPVHEHKETFLQLSWKEVLTPAIITNAVTTTDGTSDGRYVVILTSNNGKQLGPYKLYSSKHRKKAEEALQSIQDIIKPLSRISLTQDLLTHLLLPCPKAMETLPFVLSQYLTKIPPCSEHWKAMVQVTINGLALAYCLCDISNMAVLKDLSQTRMNLALSHPVTGSTLIHLAIRVGHECLRETIDCLHKVLCLKKYIEYINQPAIESLSAIVPTYYKRISLPRRASSAIFEEPLEKIFRSNGDTGVFPIELGAITPLMLAVRKNCVRSVHYLLVDGADPNYQDLVKGMTALHIAAVLCNVSIIKLLLAFDADLTLTDGEGKTPVDIAKEREGDGTEECVAVMENVMQLRGKTCYSTSLEMILEEYNDDNVPISKVNYYHDPKMDDCDEKASESNDQVQSKLLNHDLSYPLDEVTLLSLDGGGSRGAIVSYMLYHIEQRMRKLANNPDLQIRHYFNWYAGTSVGSLLALCMSHNNCDTHYLMRTIVHNRHHALAGKRLYDGPTQDYFAQKLIGNHNIRDVTDPKVLITTTLAEKDPPQLIRITNYREDPGNGRQWKAWEAGRASGAAPLFFPSFEGKYVDGGVLAINPTEHALHDIHVYDGRKVGLILSLGTGEMELETNESIDLIKPRLTHFLSDIQNNLKFLKGLTSILTANVSNTDDTVSHSKSWCESQGGVYHRLSPPISQRIPLDETSDDAFVLMFYEAYLHLLIIDEEITSIARSLIFQGSKCKKTVLQYKSTWV